MFCKKTLRRFLSKKYVIVFVCCWNLYRFYYHPKTTFSSITISAFVLKTFYYRNSKIYENTDTVIMLSVGERFDHDKTKFLCRRELDSREMQTTIGKSMEITKNDPLCKFQLSRLVCNFPISSHSTTKFEIAASGKRITEKSFQKFDLDVPNKTPYGFVSCMSRMVAFENWAVFLLVMESFKFYGGDLMVTHIECVTEEMMKLIKIYENEKLLSIRHAFKGDKKNFIKFDPDAEMMYGNQMVNSHECLYEFRESAEFIALNDWDEILSVSNGNQFYTLFDKLANTHPFAASFSIPRRYSFLQKAFRPNNESQFSLGKIYKESILYPKIYNSPKLVVRPAFVAGVDFHNLFVTEIDEFHEVQINQSDAIFLHAKNLILDNEEKEGIPDDLDSNNKIEHFLNRKIIQENYEKMVKKHNLNTAKFSYQMVFNSLIRDAHTDIETHLSTLTSCPTHKKYKFPLQKKNVIKTVADYEKPYKKSSFIWHKKKQSYFIQSSMGCL